MSSPSSSSSLDSLFDTSPPTLEIPLASRSTPSIPGLYIFPSLLPSETAHRALSAIVEADHFSSGKRDQAMFFSSPSSTSSLPLYLIRLLDDLQAVSRAYIPPDIHELVFSQPSQPAGRQAILNLYLPVAGITPHIDLPHRYADGVLGVSLIGGCTMVFTRPSVGDTEPEERDLERFDVYLPPRSVYVLSGEARWDWAHGIERREEDLVESDGGRRATTVMRDTRVSATFRWMTEGGDLLS